MTDDASRITRVEARLDGHEALCTERWRELRDSVAAMRVTQNTNHADNAVRLRAIEDGITSNRGSWKVIAALMTAAGTIGAGVMGLAIKAVPLLGNVIR